MKIINCKQGTDEWLKARLGVATASNFKKIVQPVSGDLSSTLKHYALELASQLLTTDQEETYQSEAMARGNELEPEARQDYEEFYFTKVEEVGFVSCGDYGYSPDGLVGEDGLVEFKCPNQVTHTKYLSENRLPLEYKPQVLGGLLCMPERKWCDFVSYHPSFIGDKKRFIKRIYRKDNEEFIDKLKKGLEKITILKQEILSKIKEDGA
jgi:hypothetical protein